MNANPARSSPVDDVWPLTPMQEGFFFHALYDTEGADAYVVQDVSDIAGPLDIQRLRRSWQAMLDRHAALRACFRRPPGRGGEPAPGAAVADVVIRLADPCRSG